MCVDVKPDAWGIVGGACFGLFVASKTKKLCFLFYCEKENGGS